MIKTARQLKDLIRNLSREKSADAQILMRNYMMERFLERISLSEYRDKFILKGGMLVAAMVGLDARSTMDLDATIKGANVNVEDIENLISSIVTVPIDDGVKFQLKSISEIMEDKLESGLYCELTDKTLHDGYIEYTLLYDMIANRITIDEVRAENGSLRLMKNLVWEYDALPHALIAGGTGGGKTYFLLTLIEALLHTNAVLYVLDPKNADLADLGTVMGNVYHTKEEMIDCVNAFYEGMVQRSEEMKRHPNYKTGENYAYLGLPPCFLIFDEYVAFFEMLGTKESVSLLSQLKKIVMLGRQAGYFLIVACQRPDAKYFSDGIRDNFNFRVGLGRISELGYGMLFGSDVKKQFFQKRIKGRGYCDVGTSVISEFYTPLVPKGHDFLQTIGSLAQARQDGTATCEAKGDGTD